MSTWAALIAIAVSICAVIAVVIAIRRARREAERYCGVCGEVSQWAPRQGCPVCKYDREVETR